MGVTIAATGHNKPLAGVVDNFCLAFFDKGFGTSLVADVNKFAVLDCERLDNPIVLGGEDFSVNHKVGVSFSCRENFSGNRHCQRRH